MAQMSFSELRRRVAAVTVGASDASISLFQFRYDINMIFTKYRDIDIDIDIKYRYVRKMHAFCKLKF